MLDILVAYSAGPKAKSFSTAVVDDIFKGVKLIMPKGAFVSLDKRRETLAGNLLSAFQRRFADTKEGVVEATRVADFAAWPNHDSSDKTVFGNDHIETIIEHFREVLNSNEVNIDDALAEWNMLKLNLYRRYKENSLTLKQHHIAL